KLFFRTQVELVAARVEAFLGEAFGSVVDQLAVRPDAQDGLDRAFADRDRERTVVSVVGAPAAARAAVLLIGVLDQLVGPDHVTRQPVGAVDDRDRRAVLRVLCPPVFNARAILPRRREQGCPQRGTQREPYLRHAEERA